MQNYPEPARRLVAEMIAAAEREPARAVAFQGAPGANSHRAVIEQFPGGLPYPCFSFEDALDAVKEGRAGQAMIPIENSLHGRVADIHFLLPESGLAIVGEHFLPIEPSLIGKAGHPIREVMSHPQALGQSRHWLRTRGLRPVAYADTAAAVAAVAELRDWGIAAIAPAFAAELYGLDVLEEGIADEAHNMTRFMILAREQRRPESGDRMTTFTFEVKNIPAALYKAMGGFATNGVNMTKLESYQRGASFSATEFYADIEGAPGDPAVDRALDELRFHSKWVNVLGVYQQARKRG
ncbi:prephenate dehydratase [Sphingomonas sp. MAH-20]|uniref:prephenate dehydratase n=1 Tax=Sphingomonas horti TaxID=2682842 RepID=A0A6I4J2B3_9SPHN|nr:MULTISPECIES: prephenate dehydratase [Sphingomonas]MBA2918789.1 prephenate dehydratase [Sphingomonas sp. CGMCC 1.13658]MVO78822.1 prephenate dehydratase [Sphingomonas horti]